MGVVLLFPLTVQARPHRYDMTVTYDAQKHRLEGTTQITFTNTGETPLSEVYLFLYPNFFSEKNPQKDEAFYLRAYPTQFNPGGMALHAVYDRDQNPLAVSDFMGLATLQEIRLDPPIAPGASFALTIPFTTSVPERFGVFGQFRNSVMLHGGWHPYLPPLVNGKWDLHGPPPDSEFHVTVTLPSDWEIVASTTLQPVYQDKTQNTFSGVAVLPYFSLGFVNASFRQEKSHEGRRLSYTGPRAQQAYGAQILESAVKAVSFFLSQWGSLPHTEISMVHAYLHQDLVTVGAKMLYMDSKLFKVLPALKRFHDVRVAKGVFHLLLQEMLPEEETWVIETLAALMAGQYAQYRYSDTPDLKTWLSPISFLPFADHLLYSKSIPLRHVYLNETDTDDETLLTFHQLRQSGVSGSKRLVKQMGEEKLLRVLEDYKAAIRAGERPRFTERLIYHYPEMERWVATRHHFFSPVDFSIHTIQREKIEEGFRTTLHLKKEGSTVEPVEIKLQEKGGTIRMLSWDGVGNDYKTDLITPSPISAVTLDPEEKVFDLKRGNNHSPRLWKILLNRYDVGYDLTTHFFRYNAGMVFRPIHDATEQIHVDLSHTDQMDTQGLRYRFRLNKKHQWSVGLSSRVPRSLSGGAAETSYTANLFYTFYFSDLSLFPEELEWLTGATPSIALTLGYEQDFIDRPYDRLTLALLDLRRSFPFAYYHEISTRFLLGFSEGELFRNNRFFLGGEGGLRGYTPLRFEGEQIVLFSVEYRFPVRYETDINLLGLALTHTLQGALFADMGSVTDEESEWYRAQIRYDVGAGLRWFLDSFAVLPVILRVDVAWPLDSPLIQENVPHYYISAGQSF